MKKFSDVFPEEQVLLEQQGWWIKGFLNVKTGTIILTDERICFIEEKVVVGGLLVKAADAALGISKPKLKVDIPLTEVKEWRNPRKVDIHVENKEGKVFKLRGTDFPVWDAKLKELTANL